MNTVKGLPGLRRARKSKGLGQASLAKAVGVTGQFISFLETGKYNSGMPLAQRIADTLDVTVDELLRQDCQEKSA